MENNIDSQQEKVEVLFKLAESSWKEYERRVRAEWQINFSLWAGLAILTGFSITHGKTFHWWLTVPFVLFILGIYINFQWGLFKSNRNDQKRRFYYLKMVSSIMNIADPKDDEKRSKELDKFIHNWSQVSQILMTIVFLIIMFIGLTGICESGL